MISQIKMILNWAFLRHLTRKLCSSIGTLQTQNSITKVIGSWGQRRKMDQDKHRATFLSMKNKKSKGIWMITSKMAQGWRTRVSLTVWMTIRVVIVWMKLISTGKHRMITRGATRHRIIEIWQMAWRQLARKAIEGQRARSVLTERRPQRPKIS